VSDHFHPGQILSATLEGGWHGEMVNRKKDGTVFPVEVWTSAVRDRAGSVIAAVGVARDITERKHDEALLQERDMWLRKTQSVGKVGSYNLDIPADRWTSSEILDEIFGIGPDTPKTVETWHLLVHPDEREEMLRYFLKDVVAAKRPFNKEYRIVRKSTGELRWVWGQGELTYDAAGIPVQMFGTIQDITDRAIAQEQIRASLREKEVLLKEIHHRVKNNLQIISSLLSLQSQQIRNRKALDALTESQARVRSMALIHEQLYQSQDLAHIDFSQYVRDLAAHLFRTYLTQGPNVRLIVDVRNVYLDADHAITCGMIINELVSNALKHAFAAGAQGTLRIATEWESEDMLRLLVGDSGRGIPPSIDHTNAPSLGLKLVRMLAEQLRGTIELSRTGGTTFTVRFSTKPVRRT
jgi:PAS domain S-box-containing protein